MNINIIKYITKKRTLFSFFIFLQILISNLLIQPLKSFYDFDLIKTNRNKSINKNIKLSKGSYPLLISEIEWKIIKDKDVVMLKGSNSTNLHIVSNNLINLS